MSNLKSQLVKDMKNYLKAGDKSSLMVVRYFLSKVKNFEIDNGEINDEQVVDLARKEIKQLNESIVEYQKASRDDLISEEKNKITILKKYLPAELNDDELKTKIKEILKETDSDNFGLAMKAVMSQLKGKADGQRISKLVKELLK